MNYRLCTVLALLIVASLRAEPPNPERLTRTEWARNPMLQDPVAFAFDHRGGAYIVESARRSTVDIDIRAHKKWLLEDLANDDFESMRDFFRRKMATARSDENKSWLKDRTGDGIHDYHDLTTISERIRYLADSNGDGTADISTVFADANLQPAHDVVSSRIDTR